MAHRYAVYLAPATESPLWRFGSAIIGYDAATGAEPPAPDIAGFDPENWHALTAEPRRYGFHGTLKAPFRLADDKTEADLDALLHAFAAEHHPFELPPLVVRAIGTFVALVPPGPVPTLDDLARCAVVEVDPARAPLTPEELARRRPDQLSARQRAHLDRYGYPYVCEDFRFHMTLTGPLEDAAHTHALNALTEAYAASGASVPLRVSDVGLYVQDRPGARFRLARRIPLGTGA
ncbi:DUF1045 domain-containing protein [Xanthobacter agilis]|jgi:putative phosphonate metabolism protein|uniref:Phosphonate metabolism protein n=1 Tax=Xanthobacter agilis TaxID=47492 RepID=A0ABU0L9N8_XANAG|nr:DUF1045 domain-containing protein [Xanthobacter agilis]MDQ0503836.1 putative phosphonate metabolism protein [Xanthobacter agilis]